MEKSRYEEELSTLKHLEDFLNPSNIVEWRQGWANANREGMRVVFLDTVSFEEKYIFDIDDFKVQLDAIIRKVKVEIRSQKQHSLENSPNSHIMDSDIATRLINALNSVTASNVPAGFKTLIQETFTNLKEQLLDRLAISVHFPAVSQGSISDDADPHKIVRRKNTENFKKAINRYFGYWNEEKLQYEQIMTPDEYKRFSKLLLDVLLNGSVPTDIVKFKPLKGVSNGELQYRFFTLHRDLFGIQPVNDFVPVFVKKAFEQFNSVDKWQTIKSKWSQKPKKIDDL